MPNLVILSRMNYVHYLWNGKLIHLHYLHSYLLLCRNLIVEMFAVINSQLQVVRS
jgi:hypothetical protein